MDRDPGRPLGAGRFSTTVFTELTALAERTGAINLGQGFPDEDGPEAVLRTACDALVSGENQYPPLGGLPGLRAAVARQRQRRYGLGYDPEDEILVTTGATEAITAAVLALCGPGDEVIVVDPAYDAYVAAVTLAGGRCRRVPLLRDGGTGFVLDPDELQRAVTPRSRLLILNTPHNPTGKVFDRTELSGIARFCVRNDLIAVVDEVYEYLVYDGAGHLPPAALPGMRERTLSVSSAGKTFNVTGWKVGWCCGPSDLVAAVRSVKQYLTFASAAPLQRAVAEALDTQEDWVTRWREDLRGRRDLLAAGLTGAGLPVITPEGGYFLQADVSDLTRRDAVEFCRDLPAAAGIVALPTTAFCEKPGAYRSLVRFAFCKRRDLLAEAVTRVGHLRRPSPPVPSQHLEKT
ncbi:pyridoxal phosphate-dependent aminotransferase [Streptomyces leeuwenhoekii]|uniref:Aminotransferase YbdL n=1 Tax=Streptomyces leeuwenhoekii TaxID=1437453 RepID=A0A0F7VMZ1_STRLW|nr:pyridoxal phosphate-dependent aminotransferase [Streptomyces leeuwenhoekii]CQR59558.1 Aminotransferase YbdL [Streptomyces leeuwenhoekii]